MVKGVSTAKATQVKDRLVRGRCDCLNIAGNLQVFLFKLDQISDIACNTPATKHWLLWNKLYLYPLKRSLNVRELPSACGQCSPDKCVICVADRLRPRHGTVIVLVPPPSYILHIKWPHCAVTLTYVRFSLLFHPGHIIYSSSALSLFSLIKHLSAVLIDIAFNRVSVKCLLLI